MSQTTLPGDLLKLTRKDAYNEEYVESFPEDVSRIIKVLNLNGYDATRSDVCWAWNLHSDNYCARWLILPEKDDVLLGQVMMYLEPENDHKRFASDSD